MSKKEINVLMVTGVYFPEVNGATLQCMRIISLLKKEVNFSVLTTTKYKDLVKRTVIDGIYVSRSYIGNSGFKLLQIIKIFSIFFIKRIDIVHLHGFSSRSALIVLISKLLNKKVIIKMTSLGHDDTVSIKNKSRLFFLIFSLADTYIGVTPIFKNMYSRSTLDKSKYYQIPNGVDTSLFKPLDNKKEKKLLRSKLGLPIDMKLILVVGHFSIEKSMQHVLDAWTRIQSNSDTKSGVIFIGNTNSNDFEIDESLVNLMHSKSKLFFGKSVFFFEKVTNIEQYYQVSDIYVLSSAREGLPNTLLEAMSCALPVISTRLIGITDWVLNHNINGMMYDYGDIDALGILLENLLQDGNLCKRIGSNARTTIKDDFNILSTAERIHNIYEDL